MVSPQLADSSRPILAVVVPWLDDPALARICTAAAPLVASGQIEVIISVDGGGGPRQRAVLDHCLALMDPQRRARVVESSINAGPGAARNIGLAAVSAKYVTFTDADDAPDFDEMVRVAHHMKQRDLQVVAGGFEIYTETLIRRRHIPESQASLRAELVDIAGVWRFLYSTDWLQTCRCKFESTRYGEDLLFLLCVAECAPRYGAWPEVVYRYADSESSRRLTRIRATAHDLETLRHGLWTHAKSRSPEHRALAAYWITRIAVRQRSPLVLNNPSEHSPVRKLTGLIKLLVDGSQAHRQRLKSRDADR